MRKYFLSLVAMAAMILFSGCNKNEDFYISENGDMVTFNIATPEMGTRAFSDGTTANKLIVAVYQGGQYRETLTQNVAINGSAQVSLPLVTGVTYDIVFWAYADGAPYTFSTANNEFVVSVDYANVTANNENLDAFYANRLGYEVKGPKTETVELTRPFAQLNVATLDYDLAAKSGIEITETAIEVEGVYTSFNLKTQNGAIDANSATTITLKSNNTPKAQNENLSGYETYSWLSMNYLLVNDKTNIRAKMTATNENENVTLTREWHNIPVQRNFRTNILGNILTTTTDFNVVIDEEFAGEQPETMDEKLRLAAQVGGTVILSDNLKLSSPLVITSQMTLDLNGKTLSYETTENKSDQLIENKGYLVIEDSKGNGKISYKYRGTPDNTYGYGNQTIQNLGTLIVKGGTIENISGSISHASYAINTNAGATLEIQGGYISNAGHAIRQVSFGTNFNTVNISGGEIIGSRALMVQLPSSDATVAPKTNIEITGGKLTSTEATYNLAVYIYSNGSSAENVSVQIDGNAIFDGNVAINGAAVRTMPKNAVIVRGGEFNGEYGIFHYEDDVVYNDRIVLYGGSYKVNPSDYVKIAEGYTVVEKNGTYTVVIVLNNIDDLATVLENAAPGSTIVLPEVEDKTIQVKEMSKVIIDCERTENVRFVTNSDSKIEDVTIKNIDFKFTTGSGQAGAYFVIHESAVINGLTIENGTFIGDEKKNSYGITGENPNASILVKNCNFSKLGYAIQTITTGGYKSLTVESCNFEKIISWVILPQYGYTGDLTINNCSFIECTGGLVKTGAFDKTFTFTNNTLTSSTGHDGSDNKWFDVTSSGTTKVIDGNKKDDVEWIPGQNEGLKGFID